MRLVARIGAVLLRRHIVTRVRGTDGAVYLTFDDGPHPDHTPATLEVLERNGARGTFFVIGGAARAHPSLCREIVARGHGLGNHSMSHPRMRGLSLERVGREIDEGEAAVREAAPGTRPMFRPPHGKVTPTVLYACMRRGTRIAHWSIDSLDFRLDAKGVEARLRGRPPVAGDVLLFHDDGPAAAEALSVLLPEWRRAGLRFAPLPADR